MYGIDVLLLNVHDLERMNNWQISVEPIAISEVEP